MINLANLVGNEGGVGDGGERPSTRPDSGTDWRPPYQGDRDRDRDRDRYPTDTNRYPPSDGKYPYDRYPSGGNNRPDVGEYTRKLIFCLFFIRTTRQNGN